MLIKQFSMAFLCKGLCQYYTDMAERLQDVKKIWLKVYGWRERLKFLSTFQLNVFQHLSCVFCAVGVGRVRICCEHCYGNQNISIG